MNDPRDEKLLACYTIPLGQNEASLSFSGVSLVPEDFDELIDYIRLFKKQYERKAAASYTCLNDDDKTP